jgi:hypothetical protein
VPEEMIIVVFGFLLSLSVAAFMLRFLYGYRIGPDGVYLLLFNLLPIWKYDSKKILEVKRVTFGQVCSTILRHTWRVLFLGNNILGPYVVLERSGFLRYIIVTPKNADEFCAAVKGNLDNVTA